MAIIRTVTGVNDGGESFGNQTVSSVDNNQSAETGLNSSFEVRPDKMTLAEINKLSKEIGRIVFDTDNGVSRIWNGAEWKIFPETSTPIDDVLDNRIIVNQTNVAATLGGVIDSTKEYFLDGIIDLGTTQITVPTTGMTIKGFSFDISGIISSEDNYTMFISESPEIGSGNLIGFDYYVSVTGAGSKVYDLYDHNTFSAIEFNRINYINCTSLGEYHNYRQVLESGTGRFGGSPSLKFSGLMRGGARITTSIVRQLAGTMTKALFEEGTTLLMEGRFITDINVDLPTLAPLCDFREANISNNESFIISGVFVSRDGSLDSSDTNIVPNISEKSIKSLWSDNTGLPNTTKFLKADVTTEVETSITSAGTYFDLEGVFTVEDSSHIDSPVNGQFRAQSGSGTYRIIGDLTIEGGQNDVLDVRVVKSTDNGVTFPTVINHISRVVNNLQGGRDVAFFSLNFLSSLNEGDRIKIQVENITDTSNVTVETGSYVVISSI